MTKSGTPSQFELRELIRSDPIMREQAAIELLHSKPARLDLRFVIEFVDSLRKDAWDTLCALVPTQFELLHVAANVPELKLQAWSMLDLTSIGSDGLVEIIRKYDSLRSLAWREFLERQPSDQLPCQLSMPEDADLCERIWEHFTLLKSPERSDFDFLAPSFLRYAIRNRKFLNWSSEACLELLVRACIDNYSREIVEAGLRDEVLASVATTRPDLWQNLIETTDDPELLGRLVAMVACVRDAASEKLLHLACKNQNESSLINELLAIIQHSSTFRAAAWERLKIDAADNPFVGRSLLDHRDEDFREQVWRDLSSPPFSATSFMYLNSPSAFLPFLLRDWDIVRTQLNAEQTLMLISKLCRSQEFGDAYGLDTFECVIETAIEQLRSIGEAAALLIALLQPRECRVVIVPSPSVLHNIPSLQAFIATVLFERVLPALKSPTSSGEIGVDRSDLMNLFACYSGDTEPIESALLQNARTLDDYQFLACYGRSLAVLQEAWKQLTQFNLPSERLVKIIRESETLCGDVWDHLKDSASIEVLVAVAENHPQFAQEAFRIYLRSEVSRKGLRQFINKVPPVREVAAKLLLSEKLETNNPDLMWICRNIPSLGSDAKAFIMFPTQIHSMRAREIVFIDLQSQMNRIEFNFRSGGCSNHDTDVYGEVFVLGYSPSNAFDPDWWGAECWHTAGITETLRLDMERWIETEINQSFLNPRFRAVQVVKFDEEARVFVEVECVDGKVRIGLITWANSD